MSSCALQASISTPSFGGPSCLGGPFNPCWGAFEFCPPTPDRFGFGVERCQAIIMIVLFQDNQLSSANVDSGATQSVHRSSRCGYECCSDLKPLRAWPNASRLRTHIKTISNYFFFSRVSSPSHGNPFTREPKATANLAPFYPKRGDHHVSACRLRAFRWLTLGFDIFVGPIWLWKKFFNSSRVTVLYTVDFMLNSVRHPQDDHKP